MKYLLFCLLCIVSTSTLYAQDSTATRTTPTETLRKISFRSIQGDTIDFAIYMDNEKLTLIKVFSAWEAKYCHTCDHNLDFAATLHDQWKKEEKAAEALFISIDNLATTQDYTSKKTKWQVPILLDKPKQLLKAISIEKDAAELIFDAKGELIYNSEDSSLNFYEFLQEYWKEEKE